MTETERQNVDLFSGLVREHQAGLRAYIRSLGVHEIWVDDLAQEAFLVAYRRQADFRVDADYGKWLRGIARHLVANEQRKEARRSRLVQEELTGLLLTAAADDAPEIDFASRGPAMEECVARLAPHSRDLLNRRYALGENASALARQFQTSAEAIRQNLRRVRLLVRECVERKLQEAGL